MPYIQYATFLCVIGMALQAIAAELANYPLLATGMLILGTGIGFVMSPVNTDSMSRVPPAQRGQVSGLVQTLRQIGGSLGVAVVGSAILLSHDGAIEQRVQQVLPQEQRAAACELLQQASKGNPAAIAELANNSQLQIIEREVLSHSVATGWWLCTAALAGAFIAATRLRSMVHSAQVQVRS